MSQAGPFAFETMVAMVEKTIRHGAAEGCEVRPRVLLAYSGTFFYFDLAGPEAKIPEMREAVTKIILAARITGRFQVVAIVGEAWVSKRTDVEPSKDPGRREAVFYVVYGPAGEKKTSSWFIERNNGAVSLTDEWREQMFTWLDPVMEPFPIEPSAEVIAEAARILDAIDEHRTHGTVAG